MRNRSGTIARPAPSLLPLSSVTPAPTEHLIEWGVRVGGKDWTVELILDPPTAALVSPITVRIDDGEAVSEQFIVPRAKLGDLLSVLRTAVRELERAEERACVLSRLE